VDAESVGGWGSKAEDSASRMKYREAKLLRDEAMERERLQADEALKNS
jgi:hypothetical protein